ncbi:hypothetical protein [Mycolicibacterium brisbanense]
MYWTIAVLATASALLVWRLRLRTRPEWASNDDARFYVSAGTWAVIIALYWFQQSRLDPHWVWQLWPVLALSSIALLVRGIDDLDARKHSDTFIPEPIEHQTTKDGPGAFTAHTGHQVALPHISHRH